MCGESLVTISLINNVHNCKPCEERLEVIKEKSTDPHNIPPRTLESLYTSVRYGCDTKRLRMFIIDEGLQLKTDAQSIVNLKMLLLRTGGLPQKLNNQTSLSLQRNITSI